MAGASVPHVIALQGYFLDSSGTAPQAEESQRGEEIDAHLEQVTLEGFGG